jgi:hypothetical protein
MRCTGPAAMLELMAWILAAGGAAATTKEPK